MGGARIAWLLLALICSVGSLCAQLPIGPSIGNGTGADELQSLISRSVGSTAKSGEVFFEGAIDPNEYVVGPGDGFMLYYWRPTFSSVPATVNAEGDLAVPLVGMIRVADRTLTRAKAEIDEAVARSMRLGSVSASLVSPRRFRVHVTGAVALPGTVVVPATARVGDAIESAGGYLRRAVYSDGVVDSVAAGSLRRISITNRDGSVAGSADLELFFASGTMSANPLLRDGQSVNVPVRAAELPTVAVSGSVRNGGVYEWKPGDDVGTLLKLAGGLTESADGRAVKISGSTGEQTVDVVTTPDALKTRVPPGGRVLVVGLPDTSRIGAVTIVGEVAHPGGYAVTNGVTTLRDVLAAAGGLLPTAAAQSARLIRDVTPDPLAPERNRILSDGLRAVQVPSLEHDPGLAAEFARWDYSTVVLDLTATGELTGAAGDIPLNDGDRLEIPRTPLGVRIVGAVNEAGEVPWQAGARLTHYLGAAGGKNKGGWTHRAIIIKARNGSQIRYQRTMTIDPGDLIYIPPKPAYASAWNSFKDFIATAAQVATVVLVVQQTTK